MNQSQERKEVTTILTAGELELVSGGMINLYPDGENPKAQGHQRGALVSMIGYRTFGDIGL